MSARRPAPAAAHAPRYRDRKGIHQADTCRPLMDAVRRGELRLEALARGSYPGRPMPRGLLPQLRTIGYWDARRDQAWGLEEHRNEGIELTYLAGGRLGFCVDGRPHPLRAGDLTVTRPWQPHSVGAPHVTAGRLHWLILDVGVRRPHQPWRWPDWLVLDPADLRELTRMLRHNEHPVWRGSQEVGRCFADIGRLVAARHPAATLGARLALLVNELLVCVLETLRSQHVPQRASLASAERTTEMFLRELEHSSERPWTLDAMAESTGLKRTRFVHYVRRLTNRSPIEHLGFLRVQQAKAAMIAEPARTLTDIALACGFANGQYFATTFRRYAGQSPREWRAAQSPARSRSTRTIRGGTAAVKAPSKRPRSF